MLPTKWSRWIIIPIALALAAVGIGLGLVLVPAVESAATLPEPTPTPPRLAYAAPLSGECAACHTDKEKLKETVASEEELERSFIEVSQTESLHGRLGCITCHQGTSNTADVEGAHTGLVADRSPYFQENCLFCHRDVRDELPDRELLAPHSQVVNGSAQDLTCSDCHGSAGHGYDPASGKITVSMQACIDCHEERSLDVECKVCHTGEVGFNPNADCATCHPASYAQSMKEATLLAYAHAQENLVCLDCHEAEALTQLHEGVGTDTSKLKVRRYGNEFCFDCHVPNEHTSYQQVIERTVDYTVDDLEVNPHNPHEGSEEMGQTQFDCNSCHQMHRESLGINYCYGCHHAGVLECHTCHE